MGMGNFLSALVQRGVQAEGGALEGKLIGQQRQAASARQAHEDELQRALIESQMAAHRATAAREGREAESYAPYSQRVSDELERLRQQHQNRMDEIRAQGTTAAEVARVRAANSGRGGGRSDPRVAVETQNIANFQKTKDEAAKTAGDQFARMRNPAGAASADSTMRAMDDSISVHRANRNKLVGLGGQGEDTEGGGGADAILGQKTPQQWTDEVAAEHPDWPDEQIVAEAQRRARNP